MTNSREIASLILSNVYQGKNLDWALNTSKSLVKLDSRDRAFVSLLVLTALRRHGQIDKIISKFIKKPLKDGSQVIYILKIKRLGVLKGLSQLDMAIGRKREFVTIFSFFLYYQLTHLQHLDH